MNTIVRGLCLLLACFVFLIGSAFAQDDTTTTKGWKVSLVTDFTTTQTSYSNEWVGGEEGSVNWVTNTNAKAEKDLSPKFNLTSNLRVSFGQTYSQTVDDSTNTRHWSKPKKTTDLIDWENVGRFNLGLALSPYVAFRVETQFYDGSVSEKKLYFSPLKLTESAGISRLLYKRDKSEVTSRLGFGLRQIRTSTAIAVEGITGDTLEYTTESASLNDGGFESVTDATIQLSERFQYVGKLSLFKSVFFSESDADSAGTWKTIDVNWESTFNAQISKIIAVNLYLQLLYDKQVVDKGRIKQTLGLGFVFRMI